MQSFIEPNLHPIFVHFAYGLSVTAAFLYVARLFSAKGQRAENLMIAADWLLCLSAVAVVATILAGFYAFNTVAHDTPSHEAMTIHRNWAVSSGVVVLILAAVRWRARKQAPGVLFTAGMAGAALLLTLTAWWGGRLVYHHGLGVKSLPQISETGHDHVHPMHNHDMHEDEMHEDEMHEDEMLGHGPDDPHEEMPDHDHQQTHGGHDEQE